MKHASGRTKRRWMAVIATGVAATAALSGCNLSNSGSSSGKVKPGSLAKGVHLKGAKVTVGGKEFTEQLILCQMTSQALSSAGATVKEHCAINGSDSARKALTAGTIDMYWEYTGTAWMSYLKHTKPIIGSAQQYQAVAKQDAGNQITWLNAAPFNNSYEILANGAVAAKYHINTLSDFAKLAKSNPKAAKTCGASEFLARSDGWPGIEKKYGFNLPSSDVPKIAEGAIYDAVGKAKTCNFGEGDTTDGRIAALHLKVLADDKHFFPLYNPAVNVRTSVLKQYPDIAKVLNPIAKELDVATMQKLNGEVDIKGAKPEDVAHDWLKSKGFIG